MLGLGVVTRRAAGGEDGPVVWGIWSPAQILGRLQRKGPGLLVRLALI